MHVDKHALAFELTVATAIPRGAANTHLTIRAVIESNTKWQHPEQYLPCPNSIISFSGNLIGVHENVAIIAIDDMTFLPHPGITQSTVH